MERKGLRPQTVKTTYWTFAGVMVAWVCAWLLKVNLDQAVSWFAAGLGSFLYWLTAKLLIWIWPSFWLLREGGRSLGETFNFANWKSWLAWGLGIGALIGLTGLIPNWLQGNPILPTQLSFALLNVLVIASTLEEFLMRGAIQGNLVQHYPFWMANFITSLLFVILHIPGWYFMGVLGENLTQPIGGAFSIFLVSLGFGYAAHRSRSVFGGVLAHFLNNLF